MSSGVKKPPVAPKPRVKPPPPPIAPKPDPLRLQPSPAATKKPKPALAPKPCPSKTSSVPPPKSSGARAPPSTHTPPTPHTRPDTLHLLNSKNDAQSPESSHTRYIISTCVCGESTCAQCHYRLGNGGGDTHILSSPPGQNGGEEERGRREEEDVGEDCGDGLVEDLTHTPTRVKRQANTPTGLEDVTHARTDTEQATHTPTNSPHTHSSTSPDCSRDSPTQNHTPPPLPHTPSPLPQTRTQRRRSPPNTHTHSPAHTPTDTHSPSLGSRSKGEGVGPQCVCDPPRCVCWERSAPVSPVPAAPSKPLPKPIPRRPRRSELKRQDGLDTQLTHMSGNNAHANAPTPATVHVHSETVSLSDTPLPHPAVDSYTDGDEDTHPDTTADVHVENDVETHTRDNAEVCHLEAVGNHGDAEPSDSIEHTPVDDVNDDDPASIPPVPPPRQKSLSHKTSASLDNLLNHSDTHGHVHREEREGEDDEENDDDDDDDAADDDEGSYGDFARYPITRSLPKQIKFRCVPRSASAEERSPRVAPKKPQRHSMPAKHTLALTPEHVPPHAHLPVPITTFPELPAPPQDKPTWRIPLPAILFGRNQSARAGTGSSQPQSGKQRARSFSSADLAARVEGSESVKRSSFRKLLELRMSVRMLPRLLIKSSQSLDCTSAQTEIYADAMTTQNKKCLKGVTNGQGVSPGKSSSPDDSCLDDQGMAEEDQGEVEYENVPLYEEIPEYMNLPLCRLSWNPSANDDADVYEVQEPYKHKGKDNRVSGCSSLQQEEEVSSDEGDDSSSTSSKGDLCQSEDKQHEQEMKRTKVVHIATEIMSSEKVFVDVLKLLHIDFRDAVAKATRQSGKAVIEERILNQILYYLPQLYELNKDLLRELEERVAHWAEHQRLADIFVQKGPYLKMYSTYIKEFDRNIALLDEQCRKNPTFHSVLRDFEMSPRCANLALKHYLLKPVQRIPQYQLLLTDYLKNLPEDSTDYKDTQTALGIVKEVANHANDIMKQGDNFQKLMQIQYSLNGHHEIVQPGRVFLKEGTLMKLSRKVMQPRMFFLFNDALLYTTPVQSGQFKLNCMLSLAGMKVSKPSQEAYQNELNIESVERSFILSASSATERDEWLEAISKAIEDYTRKKITFISSRSQEENERTAGDDSDFPLGSKAPIWIPDLRTTMCMICTCEFTLTWRRHHCRACGKVVCQACSTNKCYLEYLKHQPARVCDHCYDKLQQKSDHSASSSISPGGRVGSSAFSFSRKQKKIPSALKEVSASTENSSMSGYLMRSKGHKKPWKRLWFVIKNKVLYTYAASEDVAALESQPLLGFFLREEKQGPAQKLQFKLYHKNTLYYIFKAEDIPTAQRWIEAFQEAMIL
ncbi:FYVE, RhoGEF and PH domain-containing protein 6 [Alosa pseudoharengus]|uniref:FYVE, RhoGEF and PH domain-containing protein 6 n=1 Tax=Alosa pseudoharengus TaxID=34774 RepID=UPI003F8A62F4